MARRTGALTTRAPGRVASSHRVAWVALTLVVAAVHGCVAERLGNELADLHSDADTPARLQVAYVREMALSAPPPSAMPAGVPGTSPKPRRVAAAAATGLAASAASAASAKERHGPAAAERPEADENAEALASAAAASAASAAAVTGALDASSSASPLPSAAGASAPPGGFEWPASTRLSFVLTGNFRGPVQGSAQVEWIRIGSHYQVHLDLHVGPSFAPLVTRQLTSDGEITAAGLTPRSFVQDTQVVLQARNQVAIAFGPDGVVLPNGERHAAVAGVQDTASQFVQLAYLFGTRPELLHVGGSIELPVAMPRQIDKVTYDMVGEETLTTDFGPVATLHLKPRFDPKPGELSAESWVAPQLRYLPVRIRIRQDAQTYVDLMIERRPELAAP